MSGPSPSRRRPALSLNGDRDEEPHHRDEHELRALLRPVEPDQVPDAALPDAHAEGGHLHRLQHRGHPVRAEVREDYVPVGIERFSASVAEKHVSCHASAHLELAIPGLQLPVEDRTIANAANKGTLMHAFMEQINGMLTPKELRGLAQAIEYIADLRKQRRFTMHLELKGEGWWLSQKPSTTADVVLHVSDEIHVVDYKFGKIPVEVDANAQLMYYGLSFMPLAPKAKGV